jgi:hypothetical protein
MAVVINDFEVVLDPPASQQPQTPAVEQAAPPAAPPPRPADLATVATHWMRRRERLRAH